MHQPTCGLYSHAHTRVVMLLHMCACLPMASQCPVSSCMLTGLCPSGSRCGGEGRVLAHTSKQHHELLLPAYLKIATVKKSGQAQPWGREGWGKGSGGKAWSPSPVPYLSLPAPFCPGGELPEFSPGSYGQSSSLAAPRLGPMCRF